MLFDYIYNPMDNFGSNGLEPRRCFKTSSSSSTSTESRTTTTNIQETTQASVDGVVGGDITQGEIINVTNEFGDEVADSFNKLIELASGSVSLAGEAGAFAISEVAERRTEQENPELSTISRMTPIVLAGLGVVAIYFFMRKK